MIQWRSENSQNVCLKNNRNVLQTGLEISNEKSKETQRLVKNTEEQCVRHRIGGEYVLPNFKLV